MTEEQQKFFNFFKKEEGFVPADKDSYKVYKKYEQYSFLQEMTPVIITTWSFATNGVYKIIKGYLCTVFFFNERTPYWTIHRPKEEERECSLKEIIDELYALSQKAGLPSFCIRFIEERFLSEFESIKGYTVNTEFNRDDCDYIYPNKDFLILSGKINGDKRSRIKKYIEQENNMRFVPITNDNINICLNIEKHWCGEKDCKLCESYAGCEKIAMEAMVDIFDENIFIGYILYENDEPNGYIISQIMNETITHVYYGKSNVVDCFAYCIYWVSKKYNDDSLYLNLNEDMGHKGIRMFKSHLGKYELWNNYICTFEKKLQ